MGQSHVSETTAERRAARLAVVEHATDPADLAELLEMLDLRREAEGPRADEDQHPS